MKTTNWIGCLGLSLGLLVVGCATVQNTEESLSAAGFKMQLADTPEQVEHLKKLPQQKLVPQKRHGELYWVYADAAQKRLYVGTPDQYDYYQQAKSSKEITEMNKNTAETELLMNEYDDIGGWGMWENWYD
ncbi:MAG: hypothetical protein AAF591_14775 [Verrucomicrobiota bacterium]